MIFAAEMTREEFPAVGYVMDVDVMKHFNAKPESVVLFHPEIYLSKYEPERVVFDKVGIFDSYDLMILSKFINF